MTNDGEHHALIRKDFGDGEHVFRLGWDEIVALEAARRPLFRMFSDISQARGAPIEDVREIVRWALIGGGKTPVLALDLVRTYVERRPVMENTELAIEIMDAALFGSPAYQERMKAQAGG